MTMGIRVSEQEEYEGVDVGECGLEAYPEFTRASADPLQAVKRRSPRERRFLSVVGAASRPRFEDRFAAWKAAPTNWGRSY
jgi:hypothetical protein